ncbi:hypothetical protein QR680_010218 [Steinernema hermaphroditum]|uniref:Uncharacterized protein n=1 Tax=Steinernema hermaphroditum TaxID=289476 RepID=A0AA39IN75_9BILA|nr:hypothetical protein QR680_010218 [Steinernema hermaphroditum]
MDSALNMLNVLQKTFTQTIFCNHGDGIDLKVEEFLSDYLDRETMARTCQHGVNGCVDREVEEWWWINEQWIKLLAKNSHQRWISSLSIKHLSGFSALTIRKGREGSVVMVRVMQKNPQRSCYEDSSREMERRKWRVRR